MKNLAGMLFAIILALCHGLAIGTGVQPENDVATPPAGSVTRTHHHHHATVTSSDDAAWWPGSYAKSGLATINLDTIDHGSELPTLSVSTKHNILTGAAGLTASTSTSKDHKPAMTVVAGDDENDIDRPPHSTTHYTRTGDDYSRPADSTSHKHTHHVPNITPGIDLSWLEERGDSGGYGDDTGPMPTVDGGYGGGGEPEVPSGGYGRPPPDVTIPAVPIPTGTGQTLYQTVTVMLSSVTPPPTSPQSQSYTVWYSTIPGSSPPSPQPTVVVIVPGTNVTDNPTVSGSQTVTVYEYTSTTEVDTTLSTQPPTEITTTPTSESSTLTRYTTWSFETNTPTGEPTPKPVTETSSGNASMVVDMRLVYSMLALSAFAGFAYSTYQSANDIRNHQDWNTKVQKDARSCYVRGFGQERSETSFDVQAFFAQYGEFNHVRFLRERSGYFTGSVSVEWKDLETKMRFLVNAPELEYGGRALMVEDKFEDLMQHMEQSQMFN